MSRRDPPRMLWALSVQQPWAEFLVSGLKNVENRTWPTGYRGPLLIHASKRLDAGWAAGLDWRLWERAVRHLHDMNTEAGSLPRGAIVGAVELTDCTQEIRSAWHAAGQWGLYVTRARRWVRPFPCVGRLGIFPVALPRTADCGR